MRQGTEVLPKSPWIGPLDEGTPGPKSAAGYGGNGHGLRASALTCVLPAAGHRLLLFGGWWPGCPALGLRTSARVRLLSCRWAKRPGTNAVLLRGASYVTDRLPALPSGATLVVGLLLRPLSAREKKKGTRSGESDSARRRLSQEKTSFSSDAEPEARLRDRTCFGRCRRGACEAA